MLLYLVRSYFSLSLELTQLGAHIDILSLDNLRDGVNQVDLVTTDLKKSFFASWNTSH